MYFLFFQGSRVITTISYHEFSKFDIRNHYNYDYFFLYYLYIINMFCFYFQMLFITANHHM